MASNVNQTPASITTPVILSWRGYGLLFLIIPSILLMLLTCRYWSDYRQNTTYMEVDKANDPVRITKAAAYILNTLIDNIQQQTVTAAKTISEMQLQSVNSTTANELNHILRSLAGLSMSCNQLNISNEGKQNYANKLKEATSCTRKNENIPVVSISKDTIFDKPSASKKRHNENQYHIEVYGSAVAFLPSISGPRTSSASLSTSLTDIPKYEETTINRWSSYFYRNGETLLHDDLQTIQYQDTEQKNSEWFHKTLKNNINGWSDPFYDPAGKTYMVTYSAIIRDGIDGNAIGVVTTDISINLLEEIIEEFIIGFDGFGALTFGNGLYIYHPEKEYIKKSLTLNDVGLLKEDPDRLLAAQHAAKKESATMSHISTTTGEKSWYIVEPIPRADWSLQNTFFKDGSYSEADYDKKRKIIIQLYSAAALLLCWLVAILININGWNNVSMWLLSILVSGVLAFGVGMVWELALDETKPKKSDDIEIDSKQAITKIVNNYLVDANENKQQKEFLTIPTGIYVQTIGLKDANTINISGRLWQIHNNPCIQACTDNCTEDKTSECIECDKLCQQRFKALTDVGVQFSSARNLKLERLADELNEDGNTVVSWLFQADIISAFDYSRYPLEVEYIDLHITPTSVDANMVLVPDVQSYKFGSNRKAGLSEELVAPGWNVFRSYFSLKPAQKSTPTFGMKQNFDSEVFDELHFKIGLKRIFVDAFISNLTPLIVVAIVLFTVALLPNSIDISRILGICVSVFFVVVFAHLAIRRNISTGEIFYLEYFFFSIYLALILVPIDAFRETLGIKIKFFDYRAGLLYKIMYWPSLLGIFYIVTIIKFI